MSAAEQSLSLAEGDQIAPKAWHESGNSQAPVLSIACNRGAPQVGFQDGDLPGSIPSDSAVQPADPIPQNDASLTQAGGNQPPKVVEPVKRPQRASALAATKRVTEFAAQQAQSNEEANNSSGSESSDQSGMKAEDAHTSDSSDKSMSDQDARDGESDVHEATPKSDATAVDHLGASISNADKGKGEQSQSETSSGSIKQEQQANTADQAHVAAARLGSTVADASAPTITAAEAAKTRHTRARKPAVAQAIADAETEPPARRRTSVLKERQRERAQSEQTDEDFVLSSSRGKPKGKGKAAGSKAGKGKRAAAAAASDRTKTAKASLPPVMEDSPEPPEEMDILLGCTKCRYLKGGCGACRDKPSMERPTSLRWKPDASRQQKGIPVAPTFHPTSEEFQDPLAYIEKIKPEGEKAGICCIVPPPGWAPPFALEKGTNGMSAESFRFLIRRQLTSHLCMRLPNTSRRRKAAASGRYGAGKVSSGANVDGAPAPEEFEENGKEEEVGEFGFHTLDRTHTLKSFASSADWVKSLHFGDPKPATDPSAAVERLSKRRKLGSYTGPEPTIQEIEGEFWRVIEAPDDVLESYYGQDLDSGHHGSGFPLPPFRQRLLEEHLQKQAVSRSKPAGKTDSDTGDDNSKRTYTKEETVYSEHAWNINNLPRCKGSVLRYYIGDELITGVMVPWLYVGSCMSAFCWHVEDHALCSINYLHMGAPKVWYGVPANASSALEEAMKDALPDLFEAAPDLMYSLVTMVSPMNLQARGVPVHRLVHHEGSFVITFPNAYHSGFNTGFNCAEAVNFGPPDWLPHGTDIAEKYRRDGKAITLSHDALLVALVSTAEAVKQAADNKQQAVSIAMCVADDGNTVSRSLSPTKAAKPDAATEAVGERITSAKAASTSQPAASKHNGDKPYAPGTGKRSDLTFLDPMNKADCPPKAIALAAGELVLRMREEKRRREAGGIAAEPPLPGKRMCGGSPGAVDEKGMYTDTEDIDCLICKCDMWLYAVVSPSCPGKAACTEHAQQLGCPRSEQVLLYRHTLGELEQLVETAKQAVPNVDAAVAAAIDRKVNPPAPVKMIPVGPVNQHLHGTQAKAASPAPLAAPAKRTRGKDKHPRGPRKKSKRISKDGAQRREAAAASSRAPRPRTSPNKRHARRPSQTDEDVPQVMKRPQRKRKAPVSADASPVAAVPTATHAMTSRKRSKPPTASAPVAEQDDASIVAAADAAAKPNKASRPAKKAVKTGPEHSVAQAVPAHIAGQQQAQSEQQAVLVPYHQPSAGAVAVAPHAALTGNSVVAAVPAHLTEQSQAANSQAQSQSGHPSALLLLAQQQMQQRLNQQSQPLPAASQQQNSSAWSEVPGTSSSAVNGPSNGQELRPLGTATAQQALLAQLISQQAAQGLNAYALDGTMHPFCSQGLAGAFLRQAMPSQRMVSQEQAQSSEQQQLNPQLQQSTESQAGVLHPSQASTPGSVEPVASHGQYPALEQSHPVSQAQEAMQQHPVLQQGTTALQAPLQSQQQQAALQNAAAVPDAMPQVQAPFAVDVSDQEQAKTLDVTSSHPKVFDPDRVLKEAMLDT
ncbi:TPA: hypothetical protein ACH3X1_007371 [Trebouxia sp. C0004]